MCCCVYESEIFFCIHFETFAWNNKKSNLMEKSGLNGGARRWRTREEKCSVYKNKIVKPFKENKFLSIYYYSS